MDSTSQSTTWEVKKQDLEESSYVDYCCGKPGLHPTGNSGRLCGTSLRIILLEEQRNQAIHPWTLIFPWLKVSLGIVSSLELVACSAWSHRVLSPRILSAPGEQCLACTVQLDYRQGTTAHAEVPCFFFKYFSRMAGGDQ